LPTRALVLLACLAFACTSAPTRSESPAQAPSGAAADRGAGSQPAAESQPAAPASAPTTAARRELAALRISHGQITSSAGNYIAAEKGYFREEGIEVEFILTGTGSDIFGFLVAGQTEVGGGLISAGAFNAFARDIPVKIVADHGANLPNASAGGAVIRADLVAPGASFQPADFAGRRIAVGSEGSAQHIALDRYLRSGGLTLADVEVVWLTLPDTLPAFQNKAIEGSYWQEPFTTIAVERGLVVRGPIGFDIVPYQQIGGILFGPRMNGDRELGLRYMRAYVRGVRDYVKGMIDRDPATFDEVVPILIQYTTVKERVLFEKAIPSGLKADPIPNVQSLVDDQEWYLAHGYQTQRVKLEDFVDTSLVEQAVRQLGPYR
jgi:NitT/TauT family transport system substrate-binding protein